MLLAVGGGWLRVCGSSGGRGGPGRLRRILAEGEGVVGHFGYGFEDYGVVGGVVGSRPQKKGAWPLTRQAGTARGSILCCLKWLTMARPVSWT